MNDEKIVTTIKTMNVKKSKDRENTFDIFKLGKKYFIRNDC